MKLCQIRFFCADTSPPELTVEQQLGDYLQYINAPTAATKKLSVHHQQAAWTVQSTAVHACDIGSSREGATVELLILSFCVLSHP